MAKVNSPSFVPYSKNNKHFNSEKVIVPVKSNDSRKSNTSELIDSNSDEQSELEEDDQQFTVNIFNAFPLPETKLLYCYISVFENNLPQEHYSPPES